MTPIRLLAIALGAATAALLERGMGVSWYIWLPISVLVYFVARYAAWAIQENRRHRKEMNGIVDKYNRGEKLDL